ncbi:MAG: fused MFS/spermidine synthase [Cyanobacteriota/Melainabacteria group bacterium]
MPTESITVKGKSASTLEKANPAASASTLLAIVFFFSGFSALLYQVAWQRILTVNYGVGSSTVTTIITVYMLGLGLGGLLGGYLSTRIKNLVGLYCAVEVLIALFGIGSLPILKLLGEATSSAPPAGALTCMFLFLCLPTLLMGTTLPILTALMMRLNATFLSAVSSLYCVNTLGASIGAFVGAYLLISFLGLDSNVYCAVLINLGLVAAVALLMPRKSLTDSTEASRIEAQNTAAQTLGRAAYLCVFLTGFIAIAYEIVWFRTVELLVKASPYAFATVLSIYLAGIALGSWMMNVILKRKKLLDRKQLYFSLQCAIAVYGIVSYSLFHWLATGPLKALVESSFWQELHPSFTLNVFSSLSAFKTGWFTYFDFLIWPALFMLIPTILMGASFPLASDLARTTSGDEGKVVGNVYFFNILGNVLGAVIAGFVFLPVLGTAASVLILSIFALPFFVLTIKQAKSTKTRGVATTLLICTVGAGLLFFPSSEEFIKSIHVNPQPDEQTRTYVEEGVDGVVVTYKNGPLVWHYINGLAHGGKQEYMYGFYRRCLDGMTYCDNLKNVLVIGYGTGSIVDALLRAEEVEKITIVELSESALKNLKKIDSFKEQLADPRVELIVDDGRRFLNRTPRGFDAIFMDPLRSKTAYSNNIYSREFMQLAGNHLNKGGVLMVWLDDYVRLPRTIASEFPYNRLYSEFCLGSNQPMTANIQRREKILKTFSPQEVEKIENFEKYLGDRDYILGRTKDSEINTDLKPRCEYYLGLMNKRQKLN